VLATLVLGLAAACGMQASEPGDEDAAGAGRGAIQPFSVAVASVTRASMTSSYSTSATLRAEKSATVTSRTRGVLEELLAEEGDTVSAGQTIARLEDDEQTLAVARYESIEEIKSRELQRLSGLKDQSIVSDNDVELVRREAREAKNDLELARLNLERTAIESPFDGIVVLRHLDVGATVSDGTPLYDLADVEPLYVDVRVPERHVVRLAPGQTVHIDADALDESVEAHIERLAPVVDAATGTVKVTVAVEHSVELRPGAFVEVDIVTDVHADVLVVPRAALVAEGRSWLVYRAVPSGDAVEAVEVLLGYEEGERVEIAGTVGDRQLAVGDEVVVLGASALSDGAPILILDRREEPAREDQAREDQAREGVDDTADEVASTSSSE